MIHGGLALDFKQIPTGGAKHCCIISKGLFSVDINTNFWNHSDFVNLRNLNKKNIWDPACHNCKALESTNQASFRFGMNDGLGIVGKTNLRGPARIDLMFDISCNLACRSCHPGASTFWQKHLKDNGLWNKPVYSDKNKDKVITALSNIDLSNLKQLVFCGGETLLGKEYWEITKWLADNVPNAKEQLTVCFQTNGTQPIPKKYFDLIERFHLVKLHVSLDGVTDKFEYLRWPASWNQVTDNILNLRAELPGNVMFVIEETVSIFNLLYQDELDTWVKENFATNREGDITNHTRHLAFGTFNTNNVTTEYKKEIDQSYFKPDWKENPHEITKMVNEIKKFDLIRKQSFAVTFPQVANFYTQYLTE
jgi:sulfatase maturation enzyme AslB (radical SAM superfamily)